ncbi:hypothetical protein ACFWSF_25650 [Streptomyces sp. NPDC058611]|uniref:hypothetical protein n=1 Tax=unclassified Streptomyces TaxID=2593676 RepID=UPI0036545CB5
MVDPEVSERIAVRRAELDGLEEQLARQLAEVRAEWDELAVAERVPRASSVRSTRRA